MPFDRANITGLVSLNLSSGAGPRSRGCFWAVAVRTRAARTDPRTSPLTIFLLFMILLPSVPLGLFYKESHGPVLRCQGRLGEFHDVRGRNAGQDVLVFEIEFPFPEEQLISGEHHRQPHIRAHLSDVGGLPAVLDLLQFPLADTLRLDLFDVLRDGLLPLLTGVGKAGCRIEGEEIRVPDTAAAGARVHGDRDLLLLDEVL